MGERAHHSIGEVLALVQEDFPDITISKIRFLESQGLLDPERTPSGYRKFYGDDIDRLEWILTQQRDNFLPLKVIRERLAEWDATGTRPSGDEQTPPPEELPVADHVEPRPTTDHAAPETAASEDGGPADGLVNERPAPDPARPENDRTDARRAASSLAAGSAEEVVPRNEPVTTQPEPDPEPEPAGPDEHAEPEPSTPDRLRVGPDDSALTAEELAARAGVPVAAVVELESFSMIESRRVGPDTYYDTEYLAVVRACRAFLDQGIEVRHLRMYKIAAEREAGVFEQLVMPLLKQRNPEARARAVSTVENLAEAGEELHAALLRQTLRHTLP